LAGIHHRKEVGTMGTAILVLVVLVGLLDRVNLSIKFKHQMGQKSGKRSPNDRLH
jgi:hypothetical protein